jgi:hypothetical protein
MWFAVDSVHVYFMLCSTFHCSHMMSIPTTHDSHHPRADEDEVDVEVEDAVVEAAAEDVDTTRMISSMALHPSPLSRVQIDGCRRRIPMPSLSLRRRSSLF